MQTQYTDALFTPSIAVRAFRKPKRQTRGSFDRARTQGDVEWQTFQPQANLIHNQLFPGMQSVNMVLAIHICDANPDLGVMDWWSSGYIGAQKEGKGFFR